MNRDSINLNLDGIYFRVKRHGKWCDICFSDLCEAEMEMVLRRWGHLETDKYIEALIRMCIQLGRAVRQIGEMFNINLGGEGDNDEG